MQADDIRKYIEEGVAARHSIDQQQLLIIGEEIARRMHSGNKLILMGNGGSAADAQHIAAEFVGKFEKERRALPAIALHTNTSSLTAIGNDYGYETVFERKIEAFANAGDIAIGISTSGNSKNVVRALKKAKELHCLTVALTGRSGGEIAAIADHVVKVDSTRTSIIQEVHIAIGHIISKIVEDTF